MKATITNDGLLIVSPENSVEHYALKKWSDNYRKEGSLDSASALMIEIALEKENNAKLIQ